MARIEIGFCAASTYHVGGDTYTVELAIGGGQFAYHAGPAPYPYFTREQAEALAAKVNATGTIDPAYWTDGYLMPLDPATVAPRPKLQLF